MGKSVTSATIKTLEPHRFAELLPLMNEKEYGSLKSDVLAKGKFEEPAKLYQGKLLDGRNRQRVSIETRIPLPTTDFKGSDAEAIRYVYSRANRRNMDDSQKACAAVNFLPHFEAEARARQADSGGKRALVEPSSTSASEASNGKLVSGKTFAQMRARLNQTGPDELERLRELHAPLCMSHSSRPVVIDCILKRMFSSSAAVPASNGTPVNGKSRDFAGLLFGVSGRYVQDAKLIKESNPKLFREVFEGKLKVSQAKMQVVRAARVQATKTLVARRVINPDECRNITGDAIKEMKKLPRRFARLVFADPPYNFGFKYLDDPTHDRLPVAKYAKWTYAWIAEAAELLTPDGAMCVMIPEEWVGLVSFAMADAKLHLRRLIVWHESFGQNGKNNFGRTCRFIWYAVKDREKYVFDAASILVESKRSTVYNDSRAMPGGKVPDALWDFSRICGTFDERIGDPGIPTQLPVALVERCIKCFTEYGDSVVDPFGGTGTTARAAVKHGRKCVLIERSPRYVQIEKRELLKVAIPSEKKES